MHRIALTAALSLTAAGCATASRAIADAAPATVGSAAVYVANEASGVVSVVDPRDGSVRIVDLKAMGYGDNPKPHDIAVEPDGSSWYVSLIGANRVLKFDREDRLVGSAAFEVPGLMALSGDGSLYVGRSMSAVNPPQRIGRIDRSTMEVEEIEVFVPQPHALAVDPTGRWVFTASLHENTLVRIDPLTDRADLTRLEGAPERAHAFVQFAVSPDGSTLVATADRTGALLVFDLTRPPAMRLVQEIDVPARPWHPAFTPDGRFVWFPNLGADAVTVVDASTWTVAAVVRGPGLAQPHGLAISPDGARVYVTSRNQEGSYAAKRGAGLGPRPGTLTVIDVGTRKILDVIELPPYGAGLGVAGAG